MPDRPGLAVLAVVVGNTSTRFGLFSNREMLSSGRCLNADRASLISQIVEASGRVPDSDRSACVVASVNHRFSDELLEEITPEIAHEIYRVEEDLPIPVERALDPGAQPGQDRLLNALAAFDSLKQACAVIDAGTAVTVDFVDGAGVFQGGAILPGAQLMLRSLHEHTAALPQVKSARPGPGFIAKDTQQAMLHGTVYGLRGAVRALVERYAEAYEAYPPVIATGTDAALLFEDDGLIEQIVPDLTLRGVEVACRRLLSEELDE